MHAEDTDLVGELSLKSLLPFVGGQLRFNISRWEDLTSDKQILQSVIGYKLEFIDGTPSQLLPPFQSCLGALESEAVNHEIKRLLDLGVLVQCEHQIGEFISTIFTRPKRDSGHRMILNLSVLNDYLQYHHFKMDTLDTALKLVFKNCYMASIDLRDAYYTVFISPQDQIFLRFIWQGNLFQFTSLPNGLCSGPRLFTKLMKPPFAHLRKLGHIITGYIDDTLLIGPSLEDTKLAISDTVKLLSQLGFVIHPKKSVFQPTHEITYLGFIINSSSMKIKLTLDKCSEIKSICNILVNKPSPSIQLVASCIGKLVAAFPGVRFGPLHYRELEKNKTLALSLNFGNFMAHMKLSSLAIQELRWWILNIDTAFSDLHHEKPDIFINSDASGQGWGCTDGTTNIGAKWNNFERKFAAENQINYLELLAAFHAIKVLCQNMHNIHVLVKLDNKTAVAYINHMGGTKSLLCNKLAKEIWCWCIQQNIWLTATYVPGQFNTIADHYSRHFNEQTEWQLNTEIFQCIVVHFGKPDIDLFASRLNTQLERFVSWFPDPDAENCDAFSIFWSDLYVYIFPPFCLIARCLQKITTDKAEGILIVPCWPTQTWFASLLHMLTKPPLILPKSKYLLVKHASDETHPMINKMHLLCCRLSGSPSHAEAFRRRLPRSSSSLGEGLHSNNTDAFSTSGWTFVCRGRQIHCTRM